MVVLLWSETEATMSKVGCDFFNTAYVGSLLVLDAAMLISSARSDAVGRRL
jgi:hypothetical protein